MIVGSIISRSQPHQLFRSDFFFFIVTKYFSLKLSKVIAITLLLLKHVWRDTKQMFCVFWIRFRSWIGTCFNLLLLLEDVLLNENVKKERFLISAIKVVAASYFGKKLKQRNFKNVWLTQYKFFSSKQMPKNVFSFVDQKQRWNETL